MSHVIMAREIQVLYGERNGMGKFDNNTDGFTPDEPGAAGVVTGLDALEASE